MQFELENLQKFGRSMGHTKLDCEDIFNIKKKTFYISFQSIFFSFPHFPLSLLKLHKGAK